MLNWKSPETGDRKAYIEATRGQDILGSDMSFANVFLLQEKYQTKLAFNEGFLFKRFFGTGARQGYSFPVGNGDPKSSIELIMAEAKELGERFRLAFVTEDEKAWLEENYTGRFLFTNDPGDSDYIYLRENLVALKGRKYSSKRNHIASFARNFTKYGLEPLTADKKDAAMEVAEQWCKEHEADKSIALEYEAIKKALENFDELELRGAVLCVDGKPAGMTVASKISGSVADIHFEKVLGEYAKNGGYAVINNLFAGMLKDCSLINREEDINIAGLRKAKLSYRPDIMLKKYSAAEVI